MMPTLLIGDYILVKKFSYSLINPITGSTLYKIGSPKRGDVVVFKYPKNPKLYYVKRIIGLPGDKIKYDANNKRITIQSSCLVHHECCLNNILVTYSSSFPSNFVKMLYPFGKSYYVDFSYDAEIQNFSGIRLMQVNECIGNISYSILMTPGRKDFCCMYYQQYGSLLSEWIVPPGEYFMMGDNRDNSEDSRYIGCIPEKNLVGKVVAVWMSYDRKQTNGFIGIRFDRIGRIY
ncbi:MAG: signal peptidase I [Candidatus Westeberhardia cardiocondylae]|nr:signal peptidase I [Candidatus Westeberhardia cardiocondylae]